MLGSFEYEILASLLRNPRDAYGATIQERVSESLEREVSFGAVYTTLDRVEGKGFVRSRWGESTPERGGRRKRYFEITGHGEQAVREAEAYFASRAGRFGVAR
jgi:PadR family transcriptional regulator PadR